MFCLFVQSHPTTVRPAKHRLRATRIARGCSCLRNGACVAPPMGAQSDRLHVHVALPARPCLLIAKGFDGVEPTGAASGVVPEKDSDPRREEERHNTG